MIGAEIERHGIPTISISLLKEVTNVIKPPRALFVPFPLGFPLGEPNNTGLQTEIIESALALLLKNETPICEDLGETQSGS